MTLPNPLRLRLDDQLCFALYAATNAVTRAYRPLLGALGITYPQYLVMLVLWQDGASPVRQIANRLQLGPSAVTPLVDQLERVGLVTRERGAVDRRLVVITPTQAGSALEHDAAVAQHAVECRTQLTKPALADLREELHALVDRMAALAVTAEPEPTEPA